MNFAAATAGQNLVVGKIEYLLTLARDGRFEESEIDNQTNLTFEPDEC